MTSAGYTIRAATADDISTMAAQRRAMFADLGHGTEAGLDAMEARFRAWVAPLMKTGAWRHWLAEIGGEAAGGAALWLSEPPPGTDEDPRVIPTVLNVYVAPEHRSRGVARALMETIIAVCRREALAPHIDLRASEMGRPLYESMGFEPTNEMRLKLQR